MTTRKFIMGVDIGFKNTGISLFELNEKDKARLKDVCLITTIKSDKKKNIRVADDDIARINKIAREFYLFYKENITPVDKLIVFAEAPSGGALSAKAHRAMGIATTIPAVMFELMDIPVDYFSPSEVKEAVTGNKNASKKEIMEKVIKMVGGKTTGGIVNKKDMTKYHLCGKKFGANFEHIADSVGAVLHGKRHSVLYKMLLDGQKSGIER